MNLRIIKRDSTGEHDPTRVLFLLPSEGEATAEDTAMLQALYSRDPRSIDDAVKLLKTTNSGQFMDRFYRGYGHDSIAELGNVVIAIENVPLHVAKILQHYPLYRGQEASTRYINFETQRFVAETEEARTYQEKLRAFYTRSLEPVKAQVARWSGLSLEDAADARTLKAASFDILRGFLPVGAVTSVAWSTDLRNLNERINNLRAYESQFYLLGTVLDKLRSLMDEVFPTSSRQRDAVVDPDILFDYFGNPLPQVDVTVLQSSHWSGDGPEGQIPAEAPLRLYLEIQAELDFASWRDFARHRSIRQTFPRLTTQRGFESWYIHQLPKSLQEEATALVEEAKQIEDVCAIPIGYKVAFYSGGLPDKWQYIVKTRTPQTVHPTLRRMMHRIVLDKPLMLIFDPKQLDMDPVWRISTKRGQQTITPKDPTA